ncbi:MAG: serine hydrolase [Prevotellaceae bacterium]|jgi:hypothetical protein|nr:serine hydrolase [Prevotellaceae bacterium]
MMKEAGLFDSILAHPDLYEVQIAYTEINRNGKNEPKFKEYHYRVNNDSYFYPSMAVALPAAVLTIEKINNIAREYEDLKRDSYVRIDTAYRTQTHVFSDKTSESGKASYSHYIKKMLLIRDKDAYNRAYEFLGQRYFNERMHKLGYRDSWFLHRLNGDETQESARHTNPVIFFRDDQKAYYRDVIYMKLWPIIIPFTPIYSQPADYNVLDYYTGRPKILKGNVEINKRLINSPMDFTYKNRMPINEIHNFLQSIMFPQTQKIKLNLTDEDYSFLYECMSMCPKNSKYPQYDQDEFPDNHSKYLAEETIPDYIKIYNNSGQGFGYMLENAYYTDTRNKVEFLLTVIIRCNKTEIFADRYYEYETVGRKFINDLGKTIYNRELSRSRKNLPIFF